MFETSTRIQSRLDAQFWGHYQNCVVNIWKLATRSQVFVLEEIRYYARWEPNSPLASRPIDSMHTHLLRHTCLDLIDDLKDLWCGWENVCALKFGQPVGAILRHPPLKLGDATIMSNDPLRPNDGRSVPVALHFILENTPACRRAVSREH